MNQIFISGINIFIIGLAFTGSVYLIQKSFIKNFYKELELIHKEHQDKIMESISLILEKHMETFREELEDNFGLQTEQLMNQLNKTNATYESKKK